MSRRSKLQSKLELLTASGKVNDRLMRRYTKEINAIDASLQDEEKATDGLKGAEGRGILVSSKRWSLRTCVSTALF